MIIGPVKDNKASAVRKPIGGHTITVNNRNSVFVGAVLLLSLLTLIYNLVVVNFGFSDIDASTKIASHDDAHDLKRFVDIIPLNYDSCVSNVSVPDNWCLDDSNIPRYVGTEVWPPRTIKHYTHAGYEQCLVDKTVVFMGDSRVRYQFMHLALYLSSQKRLICEDYQTLNSSIQRDPDCIVINEKMMVNNDWNSWYKITSELLDSDYYSNTSEVGESSHTVQSNLCDCSKEPYPGHENRFIKRSTPSGEINLVNLVNCLGYVPMNEEYPPFVKFEDAPKRSIFPTVGKWENYNVNKTLWNILPKLNTTHAFINLGWEWNTNFDDVSEFSCNIREFERHHPSIKVYFITSPPSRPNLSIDHPWNMKMLKCDCDILDRTVMNKNVPRSWYWDDLHVLSILNEEYNHRLVEKICPIAG